MGRRSRRRATANVDEPRRPAIADRQARVKVPDDVWQDFRQIAYAEGVGDALGRLVTREVERWRMARVREGSADEKAVLDALERAHELQADLAAIVSYLERRQRPTRSWSSETEW